MYSCFCCFYHNNQRWFTAVIDLTWTWVCLSLSLSLCGVCDVCVVCMASAQHPTRLINSQWMFGMECCIFALRGAATIIMVRWSPTLGRRWSIDYLNADCRAAIYYYHNHRIFIYYYLLCHCVCYNRRLLHGVLHYYYYIYLHYYHTHNTTHKC